MNRNLDVSVFERSPGEYEPGDFKDYYEEFKELIAERNEICARKDIGWFKAWCASRDHTLACVHVFMSRRVMPEHVNMTPEDREYHDKCIVLCYKIMRYYMPRYDLKDVEKTIDSPTPNFDYPLRSKPRRRKSLR